MNLNELRAEVYTITNRPDLVAQTLSAIRAATLKIHQLDYFYKDIRETGISFPASLYTQQIDYRVVDPKWRALKYLRKTDATGYSDGALIEVVSVPEMIEDAYKINRTDICYVAGQIIQVRSSTEFQYALLGYYVNPDITEAGYDSWVAIDHPYAIVYEAAASVFKMTGDTDQFAAYTALAGMQLSEVRLSNIQAIGY
jgi:hypothetical protein